MDQFERDEQAWQGKLLTWEQEQRRDYILERGTIVDSSLLNAKCFICNEWKPCVLIEVEGSKPDNQYKVDICEDCLYVGPEDDKATDKKTTSAATTTTHKGKYGGTYQTSFTSFKCDHEPTFITTVDGIRVYAGTGSELSPANCPEGVLLVNLYGKNMENDSALVSIPRGFEGLAKYEILWPSCLEIEWKDGGIPALKFGFWKELHSILKTRKFKSVMFFCFGGHGRTGTACASYMLANAPKRFSAPSAIGKVREQVCHKCVETFSQIDYVYLLDKALNDREIPPVSKKLKGSYETTATSWGADGWKPKKGKGGK